MSKIICDVCGTSYPETAEQCPICGCVRPADAAGVSGDTEERTYTYVKGGRFSKANVRKRTNAAQAVARQSEEKEKTGKGLVITAAVLLLAIIAVIVYIAFRFLMPPAVVNKPDSTTASTADSGELLCKDLKLNVSRIIFSEVGEGRMLYVETEPYNCTEEIYYESSDEDIVTVNENGKVVAVAPGEAYITVTCGDVSAICDVECAFEVESTEDTTEATEETTLPVDVELKLNRSDITFSYQGETWVIYGGDIPLSSIKWSSGNENVCTIENGKVVAQGNGTTNVYAEYGDQKVSCIIRCYFNVGNSGSGVSGNGGVSGDGGG